VRANWTYLGPMVREPLFTDDDWDRLVADHAAPNVLLVAEPQDGRGVLGFVAAHPDVGELFLLFVHPDHAGRGVGRRLLGAAHDALRAAGRHQSFLYVHADNIRAIAVYQRAGYTHDGTHRDSDFRGTTIRELRLVKHLRGGADDIGAEGPFRSAGRSRPSCARRRPGRRWLERRLADHCARLRAVEVREPHLGVRLVGVPSGAEGLPEGEPSRAACSRR
jgi:GNAT superfamily N-acetyltransferase